MTKARYNAIESSYDEKLTDEEKLEGWHFCPEWDGKLIGPGMEKGVCTCGGIVVGHCAKCSRLMTVARGITCDVCGPTTVAPLSASARDCDTPPTPSRVGPGAESHLRKNISISTEERGGA